MDTQGVYMRGGNSLGGIDCSLGSTQGGETAVGEGETGSEG